MKKTNYLIKKTFLNVITLITLLLVFQSCRQDAKIPGDKPSTSVDNYFTTLWNVDSNKKITIPVNSKYSYDYDIFWKKEDDPSINGKKLNITSNKDYTFSLPYTGRYIVKIGGIFPAIHFGKEKNINSKDIIELKQWGDIEWKSMKEAFYDCINIKITAKDKPNLSKVTDMSLMFYNTTFNGLINDWDVRNVINMEGMFRNASSFNQPISNWDVSKVTNMKDMFYGATNFNQPINTWNVGSVTTMRRMFRGASNFNQPIGNWNVRHVTNMEDMFKDAAKFNQPIEKWKVDNVVNMSGMFYNTPFDQPISNWNVRKVTNMEWMFALTSKFNQPLNEWKVDNVIDMQHMFTHSKVFDQNLSDWKVKSSAIKCIFSSMYDPIRIKKIETEDYWREHGVIDDSYPPSCSHYQEGIDD